MAYVNFSEENYAAHKELDNRIINNDKVIDKITRDRSLIDYYNETRYNFKLYEDKVFNTTKALSEDEFKEVDSKDIICATFMNCNISNIHFKNCRFIGCRFIECEFGGGGVLFDNCIFYLEGIKEKPSLNVNSNLSCLFERCNMYVRFNNCDLSYGIFKECLLDNSMFSLTNMSSVIINKCDISKIVFRDVNLSSAKILETYIVNLEFDDEYISKVDQKTFFDKIKARKKTKEEYEGIYKSYEEYADIFKANNLDNNFGEYFYQCKVAQRKALRGLSRIFSWIYWVICGYGERIYFFIISSMAIILFFSFLFLLFGINVEDKEIAYIFKNNLPSSIGEFWTQFNHALTISIGLFSAVGVMAAEPCSDMYIIGNAEILIGVIVTGVGIGTLIRKLIR